MKESNILEFESTASKVLNLLVIGASADQKKSLFCANCGSSVKIADAGWIFVRMRKTRMKNFRNARCRFGYGVEELGFLKNMVMILLWSPRGIAVSSLKHG